MDSEQAAEIKNFVRAYTKIGDDHILSLISQAEYIIRAGIPGAFVECGVWRGGSMMAVALTLAWLQVQDRDLYLFDTFEGMPKPDPVDVDCHGKAALPTFKATQTGDDTSDWCRVPIVDVSRAMQSTGYPLHRIYLVPGKVEDTLPSRTPAQIALLRLDTDWYASTKHELECLYPAVSPGGIVIVDDYGHWQGAKKATDEYLAVHVPHVQLIPVGHSVVYFVKGSDKRCHCQLAR
jgi:hypothetical protein